MTGQHSNPRRGLPNGMLDHLPHAQQLSLNTRMPEGLNCHYCDEPATTRDHVVARTRLGSNEWWNLVPSCEDCNSRKASRHSMCSCAFCWRARDLFDQGFRRRKPQQRGTSKLRYIPPRGDSEPLPPSFRGST